MSAATTWGTTKDEQALKFAGDSYLPRPDAIFYRGVSVRAPAPVVFRWLCQLRVAPYSYDWLDNFGRQSPRQLTPGLEKLVPGETTMMGWWRFELLACERDQHLTIRHRLLGVTLITYMVRRQSDDDCRLLSRVLMRYPWGPIGWLMRVFLPWVDLVMARRQLLNFKELSEKTAKGERSHATPPPDPFAKEA